MHQNFASCPDDDVGIEECGCAIVDFFRYSKTDDDLILLCCLANRVHFLTVDVNRFFCHELEEVVVLSGCHESAPDWERWDVRLWEHD